MQSYNKRDLDVLAKDTAFLRDNLEKVVRLIDILEFFNNDDLLSKKLALKGGTAKVNIPFLKRITIRSLSMTELFGSKIKALIERNACRDLYDVNNMITHDHQLDKNLLRKIVLFYLAVGGSQKLQMEYSLENVNEIQFKQIRASLIPVLKKTGNFDFATAKIKVKDYVSELLQFSENEKSFIEEFNKRNYQPQLLFENDEIIQRIANHPMALWKCGIKA